MINIIPFWWWFVAAGLLASLEILLPIYFFLWLSAASFLTGLIVWFFPEALLWQQFGLFAVLAVFVVYLGKIYKHKLFSRRIEEAGNMLNNRLHAYVGRVTPLSKEVVDNYGEVRLDDMPWKVKCSVPSLNKGEKVQVTGAEGMMLLVIPLEK